jgi:hypothetical protein
MIDPADSSAPLNACPMARKNPELFHTAVQEYCEAVQLAVQEAVARTDHRSLARIRDLARRAGREDAVPQDLIAVHLSSLVIIVKNKPEKMAKACVRQSRLLLVKMIGELALFYREQAGPRQAAVQ